MLETAKLIAGSIWQTLLILWGVLAFVITTLGIGVLAHAWIHTLQQKRRTKQ